MARTGHAILAGTVATALALVPVAAATGPSPGDVSCNSFRAEGHRYVLDGRGRLSCSAAVGYARPLIRSRGRTRPSGYACTSQSHFRRDGRCTRTAYGRVEYRRTHP